MPWSFPERPSAAVASLVAYVQRERPTIQVRPLSAYLDVAAAIGFSAYREIALLSYALGEQLYQPLLYPERREHVRASLATSFFAAQVEPKTIKEGFDAWEPLYDWVATELDKHLDSVVAELAGIRVVGMTTCFGQMFANLVLAKRLKARDPDVVIVLGGSSVSGAVGPALLEEYPFIDHVIQGEGERPLVGLLDTLAAGEPNRPVSGVLSRAAETHKTPAALTELGNLDHLPVPNFDEYAQKAAENGLEWMLAVEGSRGCWWDRTKKTGDAASTCYFCNLNVQWKGYREKSIERLVSELDELSERHGILDVFFLDNIIRSRGTGELAQRIRGLGRDFRLFYELRANVSQEDLFLLWRAGLREAQFGIEALSTSYLRRMGKGTSLIQNLSAMKTCEELGIKNAANLITHFPGASEEEIDETIDVIDRFAVIYAPLLTTRYGLGLESTVEVLRERFGIKNVTNAEHLRPGLPPEVFDRMRFMDLSFDCDTISSSWSKVAEACERWRARFGTGAPKLLMYQDGGTFLKITDLRGDAPMIGVLRGLEREVYLYCCDIRAFSRLRSRFPDASERDLTDVLEALVAEDLLFREGDKYLSLAMAQDAQAAARRIEVHALEAAATRRAAPRALSVVV